MENQDPNLQAAESAVASAARRLQKSAVEQIRCVEDCTRKSPLAALATAAAVGYVMRGLPIRALTGLFLRLALMLVRPLIFIVGAVKLYEFTRDEMPRNRDGV